MRCKQRQNLLMGEVYFHPHARQRSSVASAVAMRKEELPHEGDRMTNENVMLREEIVLDMGGMCRAMEGVVLIVVASELG